MSRGIKDIALALAAMSQVVPIQAHGRDLFDVDFPFGYQPPTQNWTADPSQFAPRYNQRKARRNARRVNRRVRR